MPVIVGNVLSWDNKKLSGHSPAASPFLKSSSFGVLTRNASKSSLVNIAEDGVVKKFEDASGGISNVRPRKISFSRK